MTLTKIKTDGVTDDAITSGKIPANAVGSSEIAANAVGSSELADNAVDTAAIADQAVDLTKLPHGTSSNDGKFLRANNGADPSFETVSIPAGTTINNNADNRVITGSGTANTLEAESGITFSGTELKIGGDTGVAGTWGLEIYQSDTTNNLGTALLAGNAGAELQLRDTVSGETIKIAANGQASFYSQKENDPMVFFTKPTGGSDTERFRINGNGQLLIGTTTNPTDSSCNLRVNFDQSTSSGRAIEISHETNGADKAGAALGLSIGNGGESTNAADLTLQTASGGSLATRMSIGEHIVKVHDGDIVIGTSGHGINFDTAGSGSDQLFDDYEEGDWSPGGSWTTIDARYIKVGRTVYAGFSLRANTTGSANVQITGLPFTAANNKGSQGGIAWGLCEHNATAGWIHGFVDENTTTGIIKKNNADNLTFGSGSNNMNNQAFIRGTFIYLAAS